VTAALLTVKLSVDEAAVVADTVVIIPLAALTVTEVDMLVDWVIVACPRFIALGPVHDWVTGLRKVIGELAAGLLA
jgi:hypothetical protein